MSTGTSEQNRRTVLQRLSAVGLVAAPALILPRTLLALEEVAPTPPQMQGPFYPNKPVNDQQFHDTDLCRKLGDHEAAKGQQIRVHGVVKNRRGKPVPSAVVEIWQACASGRYSHSLDRSTTRLLDNNFQYWGRAVTDSQGSYEFRTIIPGTYEDRLARHIHFRIDARDFKRLTTQCYFSDFGKDNAKDWMYKLLSKSERNQLTIEFDKPTQQSKPSLSSERKAKQITVQNAEDPCWKGRFDIVLS